MNKKLLAVIGPSGSGKSTYVAYAKKELGYGEIISTTTRLPRAKEQDGKDYHFVTKEEFDKIEMIEIDEYSGYFYGTAQKDLDNAYLYSDYAFMVITYEGAQIFKHLFKEKNMGIDVITIFVDTPIEELEKRMINRGDHPDKIKERIDNIKKRNEYENKQKTDYVFTVDLSLSLEDVCKQFVQLMEKINGKS